MFARRLIKPELLDHAPPEEARRSLFDLTRINKNFGGHSVILKTLRRVLRPEDDFSLLDIGAASGDTARLVHATYPRSRIVSLDYNLTNLTAAPQPKVIGNAFQLPFSSHSFDYVMCSLFLHHFEDARVVELLHSFYALARKALLICDLERNIIPYVFLPATKLLFRWHFLTVHDGKISVRAAFRKSELRELAKRAGIRKCEVSVHRPAFRVSLIAPKNNGV
ncbi:MAG: methyltransferase domain-containing protein [Acidobacteriaceae bacterium]|nr:methyltransferase domain-containing protein [Acidobacteriaceae bacterium]